MTQTDLKIFPDLSWTLGPKISITALIQAERDEFLSLLHICSYKMCVFDSVLNSEQEAP